MSASVKKQLSHFDDAGASRMVDVSDKVVTKRMARAQAFVVMQPATLRMIQDRSLSKGDVLEVARLAGIMATKQTQHLIPLCHSLGLDAVTIDFDMSSEERLRIEVRCTNHGRTGVEMEAMIGASIAAMTVYDMCKAIDRWMSIGPIELIEKAGGLSGHQLRLD